MNTDFKPVERDLVDGIAKTEVTVAQTPDVLLSKGFAERETDREKILELTIKLLAGHGIEITVDQLKNSKIFTRGASEEGFEIHISFQLGDQELGLYFLYSEEAIAALPSTEA